VSEEEDYDGESYGEEGEDGEGGTTNLVSLNIAL
jgi:hypothetical protein